MKKLLYKCLISFYRSYGKKISDRMQNYIDQDPDLRAHEAKEQLLSDSLSKPQAEEANPHLSYFENQVWEQIDREASLKKVKSHRRGPPLAFGLVAATMALCLVLAFVFKMPETKAPVEVVHNTTQRTEQVDIDSYEAEAGIIYSLVGSLENPLDQEIENMYADMKNAALFLASNFLPQDFSVNEEDES